jgi:hypothetical protein
MSQTLTARENADLDNALIHQKDAIFEMISAAAEMRSVSTLEDAERLVTFSAPLWAAVSYGYKVREARHRIAAAAESIVDCLTLAAAACRRGSKTHDSLVAQISRAHGLYVNNRNA